MITIAWDVDDVLNNLMRCWFENKWSLEHPDCKVRYEELRENPPHSILSISVKAYLESLDEFRLSDHYMKMLPVKEVMEWFDLYGERFRHIALTAVPLKAAFVSAQWVLKHFGKWIRTFHFIPSNRQAENLPRYDEDKSDFLNWLGKVDIFIDDNEKNVSSVKKSGIHCVVMPRPWNSQNQAVQEILRSLV
jgi:hypothetical protein